MSVYADAMIDRLVKIDANHAALVRALVMSHKPRRVLEYGFGAGEATRAILDGLRYNQQPFSYAVVDNWMDFAGVPPAATRDPAYAAVDFVTAAEAAHVQACAVQHDFIFSDADHCGAQDWFDTVYERLLAPGGVLIYHDVTNTGSFPNLLRIYQAVLVNGYRHALFNRNTRDDERCDRGLLVIFKG